MHFKAPALIGHQPRVGRLWNNIIYVSTRLYILPPLCSSVMMGRRDSPHPCPLSKLSAICLLTLLLGTTINTVNIIITTTSTSSNATPLHMHNSPFGLFLVVPCPLALCWLAASACAYAGRSWIMPVLVGMTMGSESVLPLNTTLVHQRGRERRHEQQQKSSVSKSTQHTPKSSIVSYNPSGALLIRSQNT